MNEESLQNWMTRDHRSECIRFIPSKMDEKLQCLPPQISLQSLSPFVVPEHPLLTSLQNWQIPLLPWAKSQYPLSPLTFGLPSHADEFVHTEYIIEIRM